MNSATSQRRSRPETERDFAAFEPLECEIGEGCGCVISVESVIFKCAKMSGWKPITHARWIRQTDQTASSQQTLPPARHAQCARAARQWAPLSSGADPARSAAYARARLNAARPPNWSA